QEEMSQFDLEIAYIAGEYNAAADTLSRIKAGALPSDCPAADISLDEGNVQAWKANPFVCSSVLSLSADATFLSHIKEGYVSDPFVKKLIEGGSLVPGVEHKDGLWFVEGRLVI
ncbi:hypothetical protein F5879DRAFT_782311, partial [Lentinula edodes]